MFFLHFRYMTDLIDKIVDFLNKDKEFRGYLATIKSINKDNQLAFCNIKMCKLYRTSMYLPYKLLEINELKIGDKFIYFPPEIDAEELVHENIKLLNPT